MNKQSSKTSNSLILGELKLFRLCVTDEIRSLKKEIINLCNQIANSKSAHVDSMEVLNNQHKNVSSEYQVESFGNTGIKLQPNFDDGANKDFNEGNTADGIDTEVNGTQSVDSLNVIEPKNNVQNSLVQENIDSEEFSEFVIEYFGNSDMNLQPSLVKDAMNEGSKQLQSNYGKIETDKNANNDTFKHQQCGKRFSLLSHLTNNNRIHTGGKVFACNQCGKNFTRANTMKEHMRIHTGETPFSCEYCGKQFKDFSNLKSHIRTHTGEPFKCEGSHKRFSNLGNLNKHIRVHNPEKPFKCKECHKCFCDVRNLNRHIMVHTGEKPFQCKECHKCFSRFDNLNRHNRVHTGEKPFECKECHQCFARFSHLKSHIRVHTGERPFKCKECHKCYTQSARLKSHVKTHRLKTI